MREIDEEVGRPFAGLSRNADVNYPDDITRAEMAVLSGIWQDLILGLGAAAEFIPNGETPTGDVKEFIRIGKKLLASLPIGKLSE